MKLDFPGAVPEIPVRDINEAAAYCENNLGFTVDWGGEELGLAGISKGNCRMLLANSDYRKECGNVGPVLIWPNLELLKVATMANKRCSRQAARNGGSNSERFARGFRLNVKWLGQL
jgi:hypothetical protein